MLHFVELRFTCRTLLGGGFRSSDNAASEAIDIFSIAGNGRGPVLVGPNVEANRPIAAGWYLG